MSSFVSNYFFYLSRAAIGLKVFDLILADSTQTHLPSLSPASGKRSFPDCFCGDSLFFLSFYEFFFFELSFPPAFC